MSVRGSFQVPPMVIHQSRSQLVLVLLAGLVVLGFGFSGALDHTLVDGLIPGAPLFIGGGGLIALLGLLLLLWPNRLTLSPEGLGYRRLFKEQRVRWVEITNIGTWVSRRRRSQTQGVCVFVRGKLKLRLPTGWPLRQEELRRLLAQAQQEWGG